jgi:hypothetical protein
LPQDEQESEGEVKLEWRDYIAFIIAAFETVLLPVIVFIVVVLIVYAIIR